MCCRCWPYLSTRHGQTCRICLLLECLVPAVFHQSSGSSPPTHHGYHSTTTRAVSAEQSNTVLPRGPFGPIDKEAGRQPGTGRLTHWTGGRQLTLNTREKDKYDIAEPLWCAAGRRACDLSGVRSGGIKRAISVKGAIFPFAPRRPTGQRKGGSEAAAA